MTTTKISKTLLAVVLGSVLASTSAFAEDTLLNKTESTADSAGKKSIAP